MGYVPQKRKLENGVIIRKLSPDHVYPYTCGYCREMRNWQGKTHEDEIMDKAVNWCNGEDWLDRVKSELPYLDHAKLDPTNQIRTLNEIHQQTGCTCDSVS